VGLGGIISLFLLPFVDDFHIFLKVFPVAVAVLPPVVNVHEFNIEQIGDVLAFCVESPLFV